MNFCNCVILNKKLLTFTRHVCAELSDAGTGRTSFPSPVWFHNGLTHAWCIPIPTACRNCLHILCVCTQEHFHTPLLDERILTSKLCLRYKHMSASKVVIFPSSAVRTPDYRRKRSIRKTKRDIKTYYTYEFFSKWRSGNHQNYHISC